MGTSARNWRTLRESCFTPGRGSISPKFWQLHCNHIVVCNDILGETVMMPSPPLVCLSCCADLVGPLLIFLDQAHRRDICRVKSPEELFQIPQRPYWAYRLFRRRGRWQLKRSEEHTSELQSPR